MLQLLRAVYPQACLISEIVKVEERNYLIQALVQVEGITIANAFATSDNLEVAQDLALKRLFNILGIQISPAKELDSFNSNNHTSTQLTPVQHLDNFQEKLPNTPPPEELENVGTNHSKLGEITREVLPAEPALTSLPPPTPNRSELLSQTQLEIKRLGWTNKQGSEHLLAKYGKKVRSELTDAELQTFRDYLQSLP